MGEAVDQVLRDGEVLLKRIAANDQARAAKRQAVGFIQLKDAGAGKVTLTGLATTNTVDRMGDVVEPDGMVCDMPIPFLLTHDHSHPLGQVTLARRVGNGIEINATLYKGVSERIDEAIRLIQIGLYPGLSIGFRSLKHEAIASGMRFLSWELIEVSAVTVPANPDGRITGAKRYAYKPTKSVSGRICKDAGHGGR